MCHVSDEALDPAPAQKQLLCAVCALFATSATKRTTHASFPQNQF